MALREKVLVTKAEKFEVKELQKIILNWQQLLILDRLLNDAYVIRRPKPSEYEHRKLLIRVFNEIALEIYGNSASCPVVEEFGSFSMDLFTTESDLDLSINFRNSPLLFPRDQKIKTLRKFARKFYALQNRGHVKGVQPIMGAKVPIVKVIDTGTGVECDLSVENRDGISKSLIIRFITSIDQRFQKLSFLMKAWAKAHDINSSKDRTLNSLSIILLVAFHLQTRDPPILPPFSAILKDGEDPKSVRRAVRNFKNYGIRNTETLGELFVSFLMKLASAEKLWPKGLCASTYLGHWTSKTWDTKIANMSVEDFTDRTQNVARAVGKSEVEKIYECIHLTNQNISRFMDVRIEELALKEFLFGVDRMLHHPSVEPESNVWKENYEENRHVVTTNPILTVNSWSTRQPPTGHWGVPVPTHHRAVTTGPVDLLVEQPFDHQRNKRTRVEEDWSTRQPPTGHWGVPVPPHYRAVTTGPVNLLVEQPFDHQRNNGTRVEEDIPYHRAVTTGPANMWAEQSFDYQQTKRMRVAEDVPTTQNRWTQGWGGVPNGGWGGAHGAASMDDHRRLQEMQHARDPWRRRPQQPPYGSSSNAYGPPFR